MANKNNYTEQTAKIFSMNNDYLKVISEKKQQIFFSCYMNNGYYRLHYVKYD